MLPIKLKSLIDKYCMGVAPSDEQMDEIMSLAAVLDVDLSEASSYMKEMIAGPTKEEREAAVKAKEEKKRLDAARRAKKAKEAAEKKAKEEAERQKEEKAEREALEKAKDKAIECGKQEFVDLGLSVKWATRNVGATSVEKSGNYYAWGETETKKNYDWSTYELSEETDNYKVKAYAKAVKQECLAQEMSKYCTNSNNGDVDDITELEPEDDAATANMGSKWKFWNRSKWRTPTADEWKELQEKCKWEWTTIKGKNGYLVIGKNGNSIFLPAAGYRNELNLVRFNEGVRYWTSSLNTKFSYSAKTFSECPDYPLATINWEDYRCYGMPVRAVIE